MSKSTIEMLKKLHSAQAIEQKDYPLKDLFTSKEPTKTLQIVGFASKHVPKYEKEGNAGYHTTIYLSNGERTGCFSSALHDFAKFFYQTAGLDPADTFNKLMFTDGGFISAKVTKIPLAEGRTTYNFELLDGEFVTVERITNNSGGALLLAATNPEE